MNFIKHLRRDIAIFAWLRKAIRRHRDDFQKPSTIRLLRIGRKPAEHQFPHRSPHDFGNQPALSLTRCLKTC
jgi:hypothetical protein